MGFLKSVFKTKPGGSAAGNFLRASMKVSSGLLAASGLPGSGLVANGLNLASKLLPTAPPSVQAQAETILWDAVTLPAVSRAQAVDVAAQAAQSLVASGATQAQAQTVAAVVQETAQMSPEKAQQSLSNSLTREDLKVIAKGALEGAKTGATDAYTDHTKDGQETKAEIVDSNGAKMMPYLLGGLALLAMFKKR